MKFAENLRKIVDKCRKKEAGKLLENEKKLGRFLEIVKELRQISKEKESLRKVKRDGGDKGVDKDN